VSASRYKIRKGCLTYYYDIRQLSREIYRECDVFEIVKNDEIFIGQITESTIKPLNIQLAERVLGYNSFDDEKAKVIKAIIKRNLDEADISYLSAFHSYCSLCSFIERQEKYKEQEYIRQGRDIVKYLKSGKWLFYLDGK